MRTLNRKGFSRLHTLIAIIAVAVVGMLLLAGCDESDNVTGGGGGSSSWTIREYTLEGNHFRGVSFVDEDNGWLVGSGGLIIRTQNGGDSWERLSTITNSDLFDVEFLDTDTGWAVGRAGRLLRTGDRGETWSNALVDVTDQAIYDLEVLNGRKLFAVGGRSKVVFSLDGGRTWDSSTVESRLDMYGLSIAGEAAVAVGDSGSILIGTDFSRAIERLAVDSSMDTTWCPDTTVVVDTIVIPPETTLVIDIIPCEIDTTLDTLLHTIDTVWARWEAAASGVTTALNSVDMIDASTGWAVGSDGVVLTTADGGTTWSDAAIAGVTNDLMKVQFDGTSNGYIVGAEGTILVTSDGGTTWNPHPVSAGFGLDLYDIAMPAGNDLVAVGKLALIRSHDRGDSWELIPSGLSQGPLPSLMDITFVDDTVGVAVGYGGAIMRTIDGGDSWEYRRLSPAHVVDDEWVNEVDFFDGSTGWAVGFADPSDLGAIWSTSDGGGSWDKQALSVGNDIVGRAEDVFFIDESHGWIAAGKTVLKTDDGGQTWTESALNLTVDLNGISFVDELKGWVVGMAGTILKTEDGGTVWTNQTSDTLISNLHDVTFVNDTTGWAIGAVGTIWRTVDGGDHWLVDETADVEVGLNTVFFADSVNGWIVGYGGTILHTTDAGLNWAKQASPTNANLNNICAADSTATNLWIVGEEGLMMSTTSGGN